MSDEKLRFAKAMKFGATAADKVLTEDQVRVYWDILKDYPIADVERAFHDLARTSKWFPKVAEIIEYITPAEANLEQLAVAEWDAVVALLRDSRAARSPNTTTERVVHGMGGYVHLGRLSAAELYWQQREFVGRWVAAQATTVAPIDRRVARDRGPQRIGTIGGDQ